MLYLFILFLFYFLAPKYWEEILNRFKLFYLHFNFKHVIIITYDDDHARFFFEDFFSSVYIFKNVIVFYCFSFLVHSIFFFHFIYLKKKIPHWIAFAFASLSSFLLGAPTDRPRVERGKTLRVCSFSSTCCAVVRCGRYARVSEGKNSVSKNNSWLG